MGKDNFLNLILPGAISAYKQFSVLPSLALAQAALESDWGDSAPGNNLFGIKYTSGCGFNKQLLWTTEYINGVETKVQDWFRAYDSMSQSVTDHGCFLSINSRYKPVLQCTNYIDACKEIQDCGYATAPDYAYQLIHIIEENDFNKWDGVRYKMQKITDATEAINLLVKEGVLNSPDYWLIALKVTKNLDVLVINMANKLTGNM